ncbi:hypothetical protein V2J09_017769 [Rumex salicifolius]
MDHVCNLPLILLTAIVAVAAAAFLRRRRKQLLPPSPRGRLPLIGHLHLLRDMPHHSLAGLAKHVGPIMYLELGRVPTVVISSAQLAREVLKSQDHVFCNRPQLISAQYLSFGCSDVTFSKYGPYWRQVRKICVTELLSSKRVSSFERIRAEETNRLVEGLWERSGSRVDLSELVFNLANDVLCRVAFGRRFEEKGLVDVLTETQSLFAGFCIGDFYPDWGWVNSLSGYKRRLEKNLGDLRAVSDKIIREHLNKEKERLVDVDVGGSNEDFVDVLLRVQKSPDLQVPISDDNLKALVLVFGLATRKKSPLLLVPSPNQDYPFLNPN